MSHPGEAIQILVEATLRGDPVLKAMFPANRVRLYDVAPDNAPEPYIVIGDDAFSDVSGDRVGLTEVTPTVDVWSLTDPPGKIEAKRMGSRIETLLLGLPTRDGPIRSAWPVLATYPMDRDNRTCHGIIRVGLAFEAA